MKRKVRLSLTGYFLIAILALLLFSIAKLRSDLNNIENYDVTTCYNTEKYSECIYGLSKLRAFRAASAYGSDKDCVESRVEYLDGRYNLYFRTCDVYIR